MIGNNAVGGQPRGMTLLADQPEFMTVQQSAQLLNVSKWMLYEAIRLGELPAIRWGRRVVVERDDLRQFLLTKRDAGQTGAVSAAETFIGRSR